MPEKTRAVPSAAAPQKDKAAKNTAAAATVQPAQNTLDKAGRTTSAGKEKGSASKVQNGAAGESQSPSAGELPPGQIVPIERPQTTDGTKVPSKDLSQILHDQWAAIESSFTDTLKYAFRCQRREWDASVQYFHDLRVNFKAFLERPDQKQELVETFQKLYNDMDDDLRSDLDAKAELHQRAEELREKLWAISDKRKEEAEAERQGYIDDRWVDDHFAIMNNIYVTMMQAEVDRYVGTKHFLLDYFKDAHGAVIDEHLPVPVTLPTIIPKSQPDSGLAASLTSGCYATGASGGNAGSASAGGGIVGGKKTTGGGGGHGKKLTKSSSHQHIASAAVRDEHGISEADLERFTDLRAAYDAGIAITLTPEEKETTEKEKEKKDKKEKKGAAPAVEPPPEPKEPEPELPADCKAAIEYENALLKYRLDRIRAKAIEDFKELVNKGVEVFHSLDDCIGQRFQGEIDAIKELTSVIREAIELEAKLPNEFVLDGETFSVNFDILTYEPEAEPRPESPVEKQVPEGFTVIQVLNISRQLREYDLMGHIPTKEFVEALQRLAVFSVGQDIIPDALASADVAQLNHLAATFDPFETGFVNWKAFVVTAARVLPISLRDLQLLRAAFRRLPSWNGRTVSKSDYMSVRAWYEDQGIADEGESQQRQRQQHQQQNQELQSASFGGMVGVAPGAAEDPPLVTKFNRGLKMKLALFHIFADPPKLGQDASGRTMSSAGSHSRVEQQQPQNQAGDKRSATSKTRLSGEESIGSSRAAAASPQPLSTAVSSLGPGVAILGEHDTPDDDNSLFDVQDFLLHMCPDEQPRSGVLKAFVAGAPFAEDGEEEDYALSPSSLYRIFHHGLRLVPETHRLGCKGHPKDPYPMDLMQRIVDEGGERGVISFEQFAQTTDALGGLLTCPLYQLCEIPLGKPTSQANQTSAGGADAPVA